MTLWPRLRAWWQRRRQRRLERRLQRQRRDVARIKARFRAYQAEAKARGVEVSGWGEFDGGELLDREGGKDGRGGYGAQVSAL